MGFIGGYQSNFNFNALQLVGDFPIDHLLGGYGVASGTDTYGLSLSTAITAYRAGLALEVKFTHPNTGASTINVDGKGAQAIRKVKNGALAELEAGDLAIYKVHILIYDGSCFQVANLYEGGSLLLPENASETVRGIAQLASTAEVNAGVDNTKVITPAKLAAYVANKLTGIWADKGLVDCSTNPLYPAGQTGDAYTVSVAGKIGGAAGVAVAVRAIIYCHAANPGGTQADVGDQWTVIQSTVELATEAIAGIARIALQTEVNDGSDNATIITPLKLKTRLDNLLASELVAGLVKIATQLEVSSGTDDSHAVTPLKLQVLLNSLLRYTTGPGLNSIIPKNGPGNIASGIFAAILNGQSNSAPGPFSVTIGQYAVAKLFGQFTKASGAFYNMRGSAQYSVLTFFRVIAADLPAQQLTLDGNGPNDSNRWLVDTHTIQHFTAKVSIVQNSGTSGQAGATWTGIFEGAVKNDTGSVTWVGGDPSLRDSRQDPGFFPTLQFSQNLDEVLISVDGMPDRSLHAMVTLSITQTKFALS